MSRSGLNPDNDVVNLATTGFSATTRLIFDSIQYAERNELHARGY